MSAGKGNAVGDKPTAQGKTTSGAKRTSGPTDAHAPLPPLVQAPPNARERALLGFDERDSTWNRPPWPTACSRSLAQSITWGTRSKWQRTLVLAARAIRIANVLDNLANDAGAADRQVPRE